MKFGKYAIIDEVKYVFEKEPDWYWIIRPPTSGEELKISKFLIQARAEMGPDGIRREYPPTSVEIQHREIALTFGGTNIPEGEKSLEEGGKPILSVGDSVEKIETVLNLMPQEMLDEIWEALGEAFPLWGPSVKKKSQKKS